MKCNKDCFNCTYDDCINDEFTAKELRGVGVDKFIPTGTEEQIRAKNYYQRNKERIKAYYQANKEHIRQYQNQYRIDNREKVNQQQRESYQRYKEARKLEAKEYRRKKSVNKIAEQENNN